ncbi:secreted RxLR effector protein 161-like [Lactuca sativa]|uniref:secreted RxLR effector protein 161-like n=1 Tax=Lactuca sativa TaxID=4236 RepID=UPI001C6898A4|nr:secreted RxLR effector protein 161-like [Lactuca sativa]
MAHGTILSSSQCPSKKVELDKMKDIPYASTIGSIMYVMNCARPDLAYAMSMDLFLVHGGVEKSLSVRCYTDASFTTDRDDCKSQSGSVFIINGAVVSWKISKKSVVAQSTRESEYIAASEAAQEAV